MYFVYVYNNPLIYCFFVITIIIVIVIIIIVIIITITVVVVIINTSWTANPKWESLMPETRRPQLGRQPVRKGKIIKQNMKTGTKTNTITAIKEFDKTKAKGQQDTEIGFYSF